MKKELKIQWCDALSGSNYEQGEVALCQLIAQKKRWCCLGVLIDLVDPDGWEHHQDGFFDRLAHPMKSRAGEYLHVDALEKVGMTMNQQRAFAVLNDNSVPFRVIALSINVLLTEDEYAQI
jgi:hypothetical protein